MLSKNKTKLINSLKTKKYRDKHGLFLVEGEKLVGELLEWGQGTELLVATAQWLKKNTVIARPGEMSIEEVTEDELKKISTLTSPNKVLAVARKRDFEDTAFDFDRDLTLYLEGVQDPGNLGTILRMADWFGIHTVFCSPDCVDQYNPKVVQSTMGAIFRVRVIYIEKNEFFESVSKSGSSPFVYGTFLDGENIYQVPLGTNGIIVIGNESKGISPALTAFINRRITIPPYPSNVTGGQESLNAAVAASVVLSEFRRRVMQPDDKQEN